MLYSGADRAIEEAKEEREEPQPISIKFKDKSLPPDLSKPITGHSFNDKFLYEKPSYFSKDSRRDESFKNEGFQDNIKFGHKSKFSITSQALRTPSKLFSKENRGKVIIDNPDRSFIKRHRKID